MGNPVRPPPAAPAQPQLPQGYQVGSTVVTELPAERGFPLRQSDFLTLCDGSAGSERAGRDLCIGVFAGAITGIIGLISSVDIPAALTKKPVFWSFVVLLVMAAGSLAGIIVYWTRMAKENTPYTRLKAAIEQFFRS